MTAFVNFVSVVVKNINIMNFLSCNIKYLRKEHSLSQEELAEQVGLRRGNISSYEKNIAEPKINNLVKIASRFNVQVVDLITKDLKYVQEHDGAEPTTIVVDEVLLNEYLTKSQEYEKILQGFKCYHSFKMSQLTEKSKDFEILSMDFEKLFEVTECMMTTHRALITYLKEKNGNCCSG